MSERLELGRWRSVGAVALLSAGLGCTRIQPALTPPEAGGAPWRELTSTHVILRTDREEADAREALVDMEQTFMALHDMGFPQLDVRNRRIVVVHFARQRDYEKFEPANTAGVFHARLPNDVYPQPTMVVWGRLDASTRTTLQHELTHMFARASLGVMPVWFSEGLAQYYETLAVEDGFAYVGRPILKLRAWAGSGWKEVRNGAFLTTYVPISYVPEVERLTAMDPPAFYVWTDRGRQPVDDEVKQGIGHYLGAFGLVHLVLQDAKYQPRFDKVMELIGQSKPFSEAWSAAFSDVSASQLELDYRQHLLNRFETMVLRTPYKLADVQMESEREIAPADVHVLWARLRPWRGSDLASSKADLESAKALAPESADVVALDAEMALDAGDLEEAGKRMEKALAARPEDEHFLLMDLMISLSLARRKAPTAELDAAGQSRIGALIRTAKSGVAFDFLARYHGSIGKTDVALVFAKRAVKADPTCAQCFATLGRLLFTSGDKAAGLRATESALSLLPDGVRDDHLEAQRIAQKAAVQQAKPEDAKPQDAKPQETKPPESKPEDAKP
ncbi:MAG: hypothetical protein U0441_19960 [Polyangiaceae bacterium]